MSKIKALYELIHALTPAEKKFFQQMSEVLDRKNDSYSVLFDIVEKQKKLKAEDIHNLYIKSGATAQFPFAMNYLYNHVLKSLQCYAVYKYPTIDHFEDVVAVSKSLRNKNLQAHSLKILNKAFQNFNQNTDWLPALYTLSEFYEDALSTGIQKVDIYKLQRLFKDETNLYNAYKIIYQAKQLDIETAAIWSDHVLLTVAEKEYFNNKINKLKRSITPETSTYAINYFTEFCVRYYIFSYQHDKAYQIVPQLTNYYVNKSQLNDADIVRYLRVLNLHMMACLETFRFNEFYKIFKLFDQLPHQHLSIQYKWIHHRIKIVKVKICEGKFKEALEEWQYIEDYRSEKNISFAPIFRNSQIFYKAMIKFGMGQYKETLDILHVVSSVKGKAYREDVYQAARLLELITYYELGYFELLENSLPAAMKYFKKHKLYEFYAIVLKSFKYLIDNQEEAIVSGFDIIYNELENLFKTNPMERSTQNYLNTMAWMMSKKEKIPFVEALSKTATNWRALVR